jgi:hypothetical protein
MFSVVFLFPGCINLASYQKTWIETHTYYGRDKKGILRLQPMGLPIDQEKTQERILIGHLTS